MDVFRSSSDLRSAMQIARISRVSRTFGASMLPIGQSRQPLDRQRLGEIVAERLGEWITERQLKPGDRLPSEPELAAHFGVARTVVREALSKLKTLGVIEVYQGKGAFVSDLPIELLFMRVRRLNPNEYGQKHLWELREILEVQAVELACQRRTREDLLRQRRTGFGRPRERTLSPHAGSSGSQSAARAVDCRTRQPF
jgi:DNA-binding FadR family transcriptional regulator